MILLCQSFIDWNKCLNSYVFGSKVCSFSCMVAPSFLMNSSYFLSVSCSLRAYESCKTQPSGVRMHAIFKYSSSMMSPSISQLWSRLALSTSSQRLALAPSSKFRTGEYPKQAQATLGACLIRSLNCPFWEKSLSSAKVYVWWTSFSPTISLKNNDVFSTFLERRTTF